MRLALLAALALVLVGCGPQPYRANPGAAVPFVIAPQHLVQAEYHRRGGKRVLPPQQVFGFYDMADPAIWVTGRPADARPIRWALHEVLEHFVPHQGGDPREALARLTAPGWDLLALDADPATRAAVLSLWSAGRE
jgi:hypothetical protein